MLKGIIHETEKRAQVHTHCRFQVSTKPRKRCFLASDMNILSWLAHAAVKALVSGVLSGKINAEEQRETSLRLGPSPSLSELEIRKMTKAVGSMKKCVARVKPV